MSAAAIEMANENIIIIPETKKKRRPKVKKEVEEPETCSVCMDTYTSTLRKKCSCKYCKEATCSKCIERYLLERFEDAHCLHCRVNYNDVALKEICTKTYLQHTYFKHRQEVLMNREKANLPGLQDAATVEKQKRELKIYINVIKTDIEVLKETRENYRTEYNTLYTDYYKKLKAKEDIYELRKKLDGLLLEIDKYNTRISTKQEEIRKLNWDIINQQGASDSTNGSEITTEKRKFIRRCTRDNCQGFLSTSWKCGICEYYSCSKCFKTLTKERDDSHECVREDLETAELIKKDSKPCPNCGEFIMKSSGCFAPNTPILMWNGTTKMSQDITIGDELVGDDGNKRVVLDTTNGVDTMYEVCQGIGENYVVNSKHTLVLTYDNERPIQSYIFNKLNYFGTNDNKYHILVSDYLILDKDVKGILKGYKVLKNGSGEIIETDIEVKEVGLGEYYGWKVDCNSRFLLNDMTCLRNCSQMFCITCQTPWDWNTGKIVTQGVIHNPHYYEWMKRNGKDAPRNPADVPCGGYPNGWNLRRVPRGVNNKIANIFYEFHRICMEIQDLSERLYRSHIDNTLATDVNVRFLLGDFDEKRWGQLLAKSERKRKFDSEIQEIFGAFRMVAVELINRVQNYSDGKIISFTQLIVPVAEKYLKELDVEIQALIQMINDALRNVSLTYSYSVPQIGKDGEYYSIKHNNFKKNKDDKDEKADETVVKSQPQYRRRRYYNDDSDDDTDIDTIDDEDDESIADTNTNDAALQAAIRASLQTR